MATEDKFNLTTIEEFLRIAGVKESTVKKNKDKIPGLTYSDGTYSILKGTRYPCDLHRYKLKNSADRRYALLKAISEYKYIGPKELFLYQEQFEALLKDLMDANLIRENGLPNHYGANAYDCTPDGDKILKKAKTEAVKEITDLVASAAGKFTGSIISEITP